MTGGSYFANGGVEHARTMLRYAQDSRKLGAVIIVVFGIVLVYGIAALLTTHNTVFIFTASLGAFMVLVGTHLRVHHGKQAAYWSERLSSWEALRRDRAVHARRLEPWEL